MKAKAYQIEALQNQIKNTYKAALIHGADFSVVEDCANRIIKIIQPQKDEFSLVKLTRANLKEVPSLLLDEGNAISFLGTRKLIWLKDADNSIINTIEDYLDHIQTDTFLLLTGDALRAKTALRTLAEQAPDILEIACYTDEARDVQLLISSFLKENGYTITPEANTLLLARLNENRRSNKSEMEKLITYMGEKKLIREEDIVDIIPDTATASFDILCHAIGTGRQKAADKACHILLSRGETPVSITRILTAHFNKILLCLDMKENGLSENEVLDKIFYKGQFKQKESMKEQLIFWNKAVVSKTLHLLMETEIQTKTTGIPPELILERTITTLTEVPKKLAKIK